MCDLLLTVYNLIRNSTLSMKMKVLIKCDGSNYKGHWEVRRLNISA